ncbi:MAG: VOC family protein [Pseudomonadota bacterium]
MTAVDKHEAPLENIIKRTTLFVRDMDVSVAWYRDVLGLEVWYDNEFILSGEGLAAGKKGDVTRLVILKAEDPVIGMIGLLQWVDPPMSTPEEVPDRVHFGMPVFVIASENARGVWERAKAKGTRIFADPREWSTAGADGRMKHFVSVSIFDPDGYFYEINQVVKIDSDKE